MGTPPFLSLTLRSRIGNSSDSNSVGKTPYSEGDDPALANKKYVPIQLCCNQEYEYQRIIINEARVQKRIHYPNDRNLDRALGLVYHFLADPEIRSYIQRKFSDKKSFIDYYTHATLDYYL